VSQLFIRRLNANAHLLLNNILLCNKQFSCWDIACVKTYANTLQCDSI